MLAPVFVQQLLQAFRLLGRQLCRRVVRKLCAQIAHEAFIEGGREEPAVLKQAKGRLFVGFHRRYLCSSCQTPDLAGIQRFLTGMRGSSLVPISRRK